MLGVSCLVKNTDLRENLNELVEYLAYARLSKNQNAGIADIYNDIRSSGIEVDLQTVGFIYNDVLPKNIEQFDSDADVNEYLLKNYNDALRRAALLQDPEPGEPGKIGQDKPELAIVDRILNMFYNRNTTAPAPNYSMQREMQEALWQGIKRKLTLEDTQKPVTTAQWEPLLKKAMSFEDLGMTDINGQLNGIAQLYDAMREQLMDATAQMEVKGDYATAEKWRGMVDKLQASTYAYLFSRQDANKFITSIMNDAGFGRQTPSGRTVIDWNKLAGETNSIQSLRDNVQKVMEKTGRYSQSVIDGVKDAFQDELNELHAKIIEFRENKLASKEENINRAKPSRSDLRRLAELNDLGIFQSAHDRLLNSIVGIPDLQQQDLDDLEQLAQAASYLYREVDKNYGSEIFASSAFQSIQRTIESIIQRNINNKSTLLKVASGTKAFFDVYMTSLLMGPLTITENWLSGVKEVGSPIWLGKGGLMNKEDQQLYGAMLMDILQRGQSFGEEVGSFAPRELYSNTLKYKFKDATKKEIAESMLAVLMTPARIGLLGFDSANKAVITNKVFKNAMYSALVKHGKSEEEATNILSEALTGKSFEKAKTDAEEILNKLNDKLPVSAKIPVNPNTIIRLANDLVKANLNANGVITNEMIEATMKGAYHVAGYGLGHEPNNIWSQGIKGIRDRSVKKEQELLKSKDWNALAWHRLKSTLTNGFILKFTGGATNWLILRAQSGLGLGLVTGLLGKNDLGVFGKHNKIDFDNKDKIEQSIKEIQGARNQIGRALTGVSYTVIGYALMYMLAGGDDEEKKKRLAALKAQKTHSYEDKKMMKELEKDVTTYKRIKANYEGNRLFKKLAPDLMLLNYYRDVDNNGWLGVLDYVMKTGGIASDFSTSAKMQDAYIFMQRGDMDAAMGSLGNIAGNQMNVPIWRSYKEWYKLAKWPFAEVSSDFQKPNSLREGAFYGGALEDWGVLNRNSTITVLPGIGVKSYDRFKAAGYEKMSDLKKNPEWYNATYTDENGNEHYILDANYRKSVKDAADKWFKEND